MLVFKFLHTTMCERLLSYSVILTEPSLHQVKTYRSVQGKDEPGP